MPQTAENILYTQLNLPRPKEGEYPSFIEEFSTRLLESGHELGTPQILFKKIGETDVAKWRKQFQGTQQQQEQKPKRERKKKEKQAKSTAVPTEQK